MTGPQSPRGRKKKGNAGERDVVDAAKKAGLRVVRRLTITSGCDLIIAPQAIWEVKNAPWSSFGGVDRASFLAAADYWRREGYPHKIFFHELDGWYACEIGRRTDGRYVGKIGLVLKEPLASFLSPSTPLPPGFPNALGTHATSEEE